MKFGKKLRATVNESYEEWRPMFMSYKDLKQRIHPRSSNDDVTTEHPDSSHSFLNENISVPTSATLDNDNLLTAVREAERKHTEFFSCFKREVDKVNDFFLDKQEDYIIEHEQLSAKADELLVAGRATRQEVNRLCQRLTNFHGELVLLENFSSVNYTGFRKILKKHDKKTGLRIQGVYLKTVLVTPFFLSDTLRKLILSTEAQLERLDKIRKFRRTSPSSLVQHGLSPSSFNLRSKTPQGSLSSRPPLPISSLPCTRVIMERPQPHAFISPSSALWRLHRDACEYGKRVRKSMSTSTSSVIENPPSRLIALMDEVQSTELGLTDSFIHSVGRPSNYCIASEEDFTMGFFVFGPDSKLQIFNSLQKGVFITRNLRGKIRVRHFVDDAVNSDGDKGAGDGDGEAKSSTQTFVRQTRNGLTNGPWPAITSNGTSSHIEWKPESWCAVFYLCVPALDLDVLPMYDLRPVGGDRFEIVQRRDVGWSFTRVRC